MQLFVALVTLCIAHGVRSQGIFGGIVNGASNILNAFLGGGGVSSSYGGGASPSYDGGASLSYGGGAISSYGDGASASYGSGDVCAQDPLVPYRKAQDDFYKRLYAKVAGRSDNHFVFSPYTIWLSLSGLAEGSDPSVQPDVFKSLFLPQQQCMRHKFYDIALHVEKPGSDVSLRRRRSLILDQSLQVNPAWLKQMKNTGLLDAAVAPIKKNPKATAQRLKEFMGTRANIVLTGNSIILDTLDYQGLWTTAFPDDTSYRAPFYSDSGQQIGSVEMMRMKKRVRLAHVPFMSTKILELPVGENGRYTMLIAVGTGNNVITGAFESFLGSIFDIFSAMTLSLVPIEVAIPKFAISSEFDVKPALNDIDIDWFWKDPAATSYLSHPAAMPGGLIQRVSIKIDSKGVEPPPSASGGNPSASGGILSGLINVASDTAFGFASAVGQDFTANRPFMFTLLDSKTHTCLFAGAFSRPHAR